MLRGQGVLAVCAVGGGGGFGWSAAHRQGVRDAVVGSSRNSSYSLFLHFPLSVVSRCHVQFSTVIDDLVIMQRQFQRLAVTEKVPRCSSSRWVTSDRRLRRTLWPSQCYRILGEIVEMTQPVPLIGVVMQTRVNVTTTIIQSGDPLWELKHALSLSLPISLPNPIPAIPLHAVKTPHLHGAPTTEETSKVKL